MTTPVAQKSALRRTSDRSGVGSGSSVSGIPELCPSALPANRGPADTASYSASSISLAMVSAGAWPPWGTVTPTM